MEIRDGLYRNWMGLGIDTKSMSIFFTDLMNIGPV